MTSQWINSLRDAGRTLRRNPGLTTIAVLALTLGIGANTVVFSVLDAVLLRPLPYRDAERLVNVAADLRGLSMPDAGMSVAEYEDLRDRTGVFDGLSFVWPMDGNLTGVNQPERVEALAVDANYFDLLGASARLGRTFQKADVRPGVSEAVVLSDGVWRRAFGGDPRVLGRKIYLDYDTFVIIGVMPPGFRHPGSTLQADVEFWITGGFGGPPWGARDKRTERRLPKAIGRLRRGVSVEAAQARLAGYASQLLQDYPGDYSGQTGWAPRIAPLQQDLAGKNNARLLLITLVAVGLVLLICCATVAHLFLARAVSRRREFAIRTALGANGGDLLRQLACESLLVAAAGAALALLMATVVTPGLMELASIHLPRINAPVVSPGVLLFTIAVTVASALLSGLSPAWHASKVEPVENLKGGSAGAGVQASRHRLQTVLVAAQIAVSLILMSGCGLLLRSFYNLLQVDPGFSAQNVLTASIWLPPPTNPQADRKYLDHDRRAAFVREVLRQARSLPGVEMVAMGAGTSVPLTGWNRGTFAVEDTTTTGGEPLTAAMTSVTPDFFGLLRIPLAEGRLFQDTDDRRRQRVCLVDRALVRRFFGGDRAVGRRIYVGPAGRAEAFEVVGVVGDVKTESFDAPETPHVYFSVYQRSDLAMTVFLRGKGDPAGLGEALRRSIGAIDADLPIFGVRTLDRVVAASMAQRRFALGMIGGFASIALGLSLLGIYGVTSFSLSERRREMGIRVALGARPVQLLGMVLVQGLRMVAWGVPVGLLGAFGLTRFLDRLLFGATAGDPLTFAAAALVLCGATMGSCYVPARKVMRTDPAVVLRAE